MEKESVEYFSKERFLAFIENLIFDNLLENEILNTLDDHFIEVIQSWEWKPDPVHVIPGISTATAFFGEHFTGPDEIRQNALKRLNGQYDEATIPYVTPEMGFPELFQISQGLTDEQYMLVQQFVAQELIQNSCEGLGVKIPEIDLFLITTSIPIEEDWAAKIANMLGIPIEKMVIYHKACNSSGSAIYDVHHHDYDPELEERVEEFNEGKRAVVCTFALETANSFIGKGDAMSAHLFATAAGATTFEYSKFADQGPLTLVTGIQEDIQEGADLLQYKKPYDKKYWPDYRKKYRVVESQYLTAPPEDWVVNMDGAKSGAYFKINGIEITKRTLNQFAEILVKTLGSEFDFRLEDGSFDLTQYTQFIKKGILHHPSNLVFESLGSKLTKKNFKIGFQPEQLQFVIPEGNAPSVIIHIALGRQLEDGEFGEGIKDGDNIMILSFGAGGSFTCGIYKFRDIKQLDAVA